MFENTESHLARIGARARPAGGPGAAEARSYCAGVLRHAGFTTNEKTFEYSAFAGSWATPLAGIVASLAAIAFYLARAFPAVVVPTLIVLVAALLLLANAGRRGVLSSRLMRRRGVNLQATRPGSEPAVWLVAHIDSKWQPVSMIARVIGIIGTTLGLLASLALALAADRASGGVAALVLLLTWLLSIPVILSVVGDRNHGTLDNATGVAAVLEAVESLPLAARVGVLITDAEELGLAGARAWARGRVPGVAVNCDSLDDVGQVTAMYSGGRPARLLSAARDAANAQGEPLRVMRLIPGILTDSVALADAGWAALTLSRGDVRTLGRIHTSRDRIEAMRGSGIAGVAAILARMATELG